MITRLTFKLSLQLFTMVISIMVFCQCRNSVEVNTELDLAEKLLPNKPDSSYIILNNIDTLTLNNENTEARYSLLKTMAIDKMGIDTTNLEVIQPAVDYFLKHGNPDEKLRTFYYLGRIYQNKNDYEGARDAFIRGKELLPIIQDSLVMGQLLVAESAILSKLPDYPKMADNHILAASIFGSVGKTQYELKSLAIALSSCVVISNKERADSIYKVLTSLLNIHPEFSRMVMPNRLSYLIKFGGRETIENAIKDAQNLDIIDEWTVKDIAYGYNDLGDNVSAKQWLDSIPKDGKVAKQPVYYLLKADILEGLGDFKGALETHRQLLKMVEKNYEATTSQDIYFAQKRYETEIENLNAIRKRERILWVALVGALVLLIVVAAISRRYRSAKRENRRQGREIERLREKHAQALEENEKLQSETESLLAAKESYLSKLERERQEKQQLQMAMMLVEEQHHKLMADKEDARQALEDAETALQKERTELERLRLENREAEMALAKEREEFEAYRTEKENVEAELANVRQEKERLEKERQSHAEIVEKMQAQIKEMEAQTTQLNELLKQKNQMPPEVKQAIHRRLRLLHGLLASQISKNDKLAAKLIAEREAIINDKEGLMNDTRLAYKAAYPNFISFLEKKGLTIPEINYACLYTLGMNGKDIGAYLQHSRHYHVSSDIRRKLGLPENATNLSIYIRKLLIRE